MEIDPKLVESLLYRGEGTDLDFKRDQYPFAGATEEQKSELLKDIIAFANAWRRETAYILIGVQEVKGGRGEIQGVANHLEDASIQQFVTSKTQRPMVFSYVAIEHDGKQLGVICIPPQRRPIFLKRNFGKLKTNVVYVRRGSATAEADPDEVARMGEDLVSVAGPSSSSPNVPRLELSQTWWSMPVYPKALSDRLYGEPTRQEIAAGLSAPAMFCVVEVANEPKTRTPVSTVAERVRATLQFYLDKQPNAHLVLPGAWATDKRPKGPEWMPILSEGPVTVEAGSPRTLVAFVQFDDEYGYALSAEKSNNDVWRDPSLRLPTKRVRVVVRIEGQWEVKEFEFVLSAEDGPRFVRSADS
jgi:hypothetical protein